MDFETVCVMRPLYFDITVLLLLAGATASGVSAVIAISRRLRGTRVVPASIVKFHHGLVLVWLVTAVILGTAWLGDHRALRVYEDSAGATAPSVRAAINRDAVATLGVAVLCAGIGLLSMLAWRGIPPRGDDEAAR